MPLQCNQAAFTPGLSPLAIAGTADDSGFGGAVMKALLWIVAALLLVAAVMLISGVGEAGVWFGVIAAGIGFVVLDRSRSHHA